MNCLKKPNEHCSLSYSHASRTLARMLFVLLLNFSRNPEPHSRNLLEPGTSLAKSLGTRNLPLQKLRNLEPTIMLGSVSWAMLRCWASAGCSRQRLRACGKGGGCVGKCFGKCFGRCCGVGGGIIEDEVLGCEGALGEGGVWRERRLGLFTVCHAVCMTYCVTCMKKRVFLRPC